jgi:hypothetical protein
MVARLAEHPFLRTALPSRGGRKEYAFAALLETIWCEIVASPSGVFLAYI